MSAEAPKTVETRRARPTRAEADAGERRRRRTPGDDGADLALSVDGAQLDRENFAYRWALGTPKRMERLHNQDWDPVEASEVGITDVQRHGMRDNGESIPQVLMRKKIEFYNEDHGAKERARREMEENMVAGAPVTEAGEGLARKDTYQPNDVNSLSRG